MMKQLRKANTLKNQIKLHRKIADEITEEARNYEERGAKEANKDFLIIATVLNTISISIHRAITKTLRGE